MIREFKVITRTTAAKLRSQRGEKGSSNSSGGVVLSASQADTGTVINLADLHTHVNLLDLNRLAIGEDDNYIRLTRWDSQANEGWGEVVEMKASAGFADEATHAKEADYADEANHAMEADHALKADEAIYAETAKEWLDRKEWLNQKLRKKDQVQFSGLTIRVPQESEEINRQLFVMQKASLGENDLDSEDLCEEGYEATSAVNPAVAEIMTTGLVDATIGALENVAGEADEAPEGSILMMSRGEYIPTLKLTEQVNSLMEKVFPFTISSLSGGGIFERGSSQTIALRWQYDRQPDSQKINGLTLGTNVREYTYTDVKSTTIYTLTAGSGGLTATKSVSASFELKKYYGVSALATLNNTEILALSQTWAARAQAATQFDCTGGKYVYYILPTSIKSGIEFWVGGLRNTHWNEEVCDVTNASGHTESYTVFRLHDLQTGVLSIEVK